MNTNHLLSKLEQIATAARDRKTSFQEAATLLRHSANYRWVGLYDVDHSARLVRNIVWSGPGAPEYPTFPIGKGLTSAAIAQKQTVNVGDVPVDPRDLTAFGTTRSEIIIPVLDRTGQSVIGTNDVESEQGKAFRKEVQDFLQSCAHVMRPLWNR